MLVPNLQAKLARKFTMIPAGYMYKKVAMKPDWLKAETVLDIYSLSHCISDDFTDYIDYWQHNGYWLFNAPAVIEEIAANEGIDLSGNSLATDIPVNEHCLFRTFQEAKEAIEGGLFKNSEPGPYRIFAVYTVL